MKPEHLLKGLLTIALIVGAAETQRVSEGITLAMESRFHYAAGYQIMPSLAPEKLATGSCLH